MTTVSFSRGKLIKNYQKPVEIALNRCYHSQCLDCNQSRESFQSVGNCRSDCRIWQEEKYSLLEMYTRFPSTWKSLYLRGIFFKSTGYTFVRLLYQNGYYNQVLFERYTPEVCLSNIPQNGCKIHFSQRGQNPPTQACYKQCCPPLGSLYCCPRELCKLQQ